MGKVYAFCLSMTLFCCATEDNSPLTQHDSTALPKQRKVRFELPAEKLGEYRNSAPSNNFARELACVLQERVAQVDREELSNQDFVGVGEFDALCVIL